MQPSTLAHLVTDTLQGLGFPDKQFLEVEDAARAVLHSLALLKQHSSFSNTNLEFKKYEWNPTGRDELLTGVPDICTPAWVERRWGSSANSVEDYWPFVPTCNLALLEEAKFRGQFRCAFYIEDGQLHIRFNYNPTDYNYRTHRIWYSPEPWMPEVFNDPALDIQGTGIPSGFHPLVSGMAEIECISSMRIRAAMDREANRELIEAWNGREKYLMMKVSEWRGRFNWHVYGTRGARRGRRRRPILGRARF